MSKTSLHEKSSDSDYARPPAFNPAINLQPSAPLLQPSSSGGESRASQLPPPSYDEAVAAPPVAAPTSFKLLFGPAGVLDIWGTLSNSIIYTMSLLGALGIMAGMVAIGAVFIHDCPLEPKIPLMLIIGGVHILVAFIVNCMDKKASNNAGNTDEEHKKSQLSRFLALLFLIWIVTLSYWVYKAYKPSFNHEDAGYCNELLYWFSFWLLNATYAIMVLVCMCSVAR